MEPLTEAGGTLTEAGGTPHGFLPLSSMSPPIPSLDTLRPAVNVIIPRVSHTHTYVSLVSCDVR